MMALAENSTALSGPSANQAGSIKLPALDNTYGALLLGTFFGLMLYSLTVYQTYRYSRLYPTDKLWIKSLVYGILILETFHTVIYMVFVYYNLVTNFFNPLSLSVSHWTTKVQAPATGATIVLCQSFYAYRVYRIGPLYVYRLLVAAAILFMTCTLGFTIASTVEAIRLSLDDFRHRSVWLNSAIFGFAVLADNCLTGTLLVVLLRSRTGMKRTDSLIDVLVIYAVNTGVLTCILGLLGFIFAVVTPDNFIYIGLSIVGVKMYANSVLAVLNCRRSLSDRLHAGFEMGSFEPNFALSGNRIDARKLQQPTPISLTVSAEMIFAPGTVQTQDGSTGSETTVASQAEHDKRGASTRSLV